MSTKTEATVDDLYRVPENGKAEIVNGELVLMSPTGGVPGRAAGEIFISLRDYERRVGGGYAFPDNVGFIVNLPHRRSFSPDAAFFKGELRGGLFLEGAPIFAVEVRSDDDYGPAAEVKMAAKRADYFAAGTLLFGMSMFCARNSCACFEPMGQMSQRFISPEKLPKQNLPFPAGRWP